MIEVLLILLLIFAIVICGLAGICVFLLIVMGKKNELRATNAAKTTDHIFETLAALETSSINSRKEAAELHALLTKLQNQTQVQDRNAELLADNLSLKMKHKEYKEFFGIILEALVEDTEFIRSSFFQKLGSMTDYGEINSQILSFQTRLGSIISAIKEYKILNEPKE